MPWGSLRDPPDACLPSPAPRVCRQTPRDDMAGLPAPWLQAALAEDKRLTAVRGASPRVSKVWLRLHRRSRPRQSCFLPPPGPPDVLVTSSASPPAGLGWGRALLSQPRGHSLSCAFPTVHLELSTGPLTISLRSSGPSAIRSWRGPWITALRCVTSIQPLSDPGQPKQTWKLWVQGPA